MQRLVYSPKAFVFIRRRNGDVADVSRYCTAGSVERRVNAVSTANFTLRNPDMFFTAKGGRHAAFFPMDPVTIYLQRLKGRPVRVFTGFLDETPYYELYPGVIEFSASCTLKKLLYTYFDPALPYTRSFLGEYGWILDGDGTIRNPRAINGIESDKDGGMGALLFATMQHIGGWKPRNLKIEALPKDLIRRMRNMLRTFEEDNEEARRELETLIERFVGSGSYGDSGGSDVDVSGYDGNVAEIIYQVGRAMGVPIKHMLAAFMTGIVESGMRNLNYGDADSKGWRQERVSIYGDGPNGATNVNAGAKRFFNECKQFDRGDSQTAGQLAADVQRPAAQYRGRYDEVRAKAVALMERTAERVNKRDKGDSDKYTRPDSPSDAAQGGYEQTTSAKRRDGRGDKPNGDVRIYAPIRGGGTITSPWGPRWGRNHNGIDVGVSVGTDCIAPCDGRIGSFAQTSGFGEQGGMIHFVFTQDVGNIRKGTVIGWGHVSEVYKKPGQEVRAGEIIAKSGYPKAPHVHFIQRNDSSDMDGNTDPAPLFKALQKGETAPTGGGDTTEGSSGNDAILSRVNATLLAQTMHWASIEEQLEATALQGNKSLMNDKPLMPFIQQMAESSLRQFQSMPNGDFFAFYPDYFGETWHRPPYWMIDDIEVLDGKVRLSDAPLVTHEYALGDTFYSGAGSLQSKLFSAGSISILNAFQSDLVSTDTDRTKNDKSRDEETTKLYHAFNRILKQDEAVQFLERYGARPDVQEFPFIRNPFFEMFMAYQRFMQAWSRQFLSPFKLTFMPELYPGGKVGFPEHGLQMYIEEVTHSWDYTSGFVTEADLSAPAAMLDKKGNPMNTNLPPNMPTALLEVAANRVTDGPPLDRPPLAPGPNGEMRPT